MLSLKVRQRRVRRGISNVVITVILIVLGVALGLALYFLSTGMLRTLGNAAGSATLSSDGSVVLTVNAMGGKVTVEGIVLDSPTGVVATVGTTPGYSLGQGATPTCSLAGVYIASAQGSNTPPWVLQNGQSASFVFKPSSTGGCNSVTSIVIFYNSGKTLQISVG
jgi:hypothetical protein